MEVAGKHQSQKGVNMAAKIVNDGKKHGLLSK